MNKKARSKNPLKPKAHFKWFYMGIVPATAQKRFTGDTTFSNLHHILGHRSTL